MKPEIQQQVMLGGPAAPVIVLYVPERACPNGEINLTLELQTSSIITAAYFRWILNPPRSPSGNFAPDRPVNVDAHAFSLGPLSVTFRKDVIQLRAIPLNSILIATADAAGPIFVSAVF